MLEADLGAVQPVILSAAKNLGIRRARFFAALRMKGPISNYLLVGHLNSKLEKKEVK